MERNRHFPGAVYLIFLKYPFSRWDGLLHEKVFFSTVAITSDEEDRPRVACSVYQGLAKWYLTHMLHIEDKQRSDHSTMGCGPGSSRNSQEKTWSCTWSWWNILYFEKYVISRDDLFPMELYWSKNFVLYFGHSSQCKYKVFIVPDHNWSRKPMKGFYEQGPMSSRCQIQSY